MPLCTYGVSSSTGKGGVDLRNPSVAAMQISCTTDPTSSAFGLPKGLYASDDIGTQIVARANRLDIDRETVAAFGDFCQFELMPKFTKCIEETGGGDGSALRLAEARQKVLDLIRPKHFPQYFSDWLAGKVKTGGAGVADADDTVTDASAVGAGNAGNDVQPDQSNST